LIFSLRVKEVHLGSVNGDWEPDFVGTVTAQYSLYENP
jgi:hypothetical protein